MKGPVWLQAGLFRFDAFSFTKKSFISKLMAWIRLYITAALIAVLVLTGHSLAVARGAPHAAGVIELCTDNGPVMVAVDTQGVPTGQSHICPDFSLMLQESFEWALKAAVRDPGQSVISQEAQARKPEPLKLGAPSARDPPSAI